MSELHTKFGELLKLERERQTVKLDEVSRELKIPEETLLQIEQGDVAALPSELYFKMFAKSYAEFLGIDYSKTVEAIREEIGEALEPSEPDASHKAGKKPSPEGPAPDPDRSRVEPDMRAFVKKVGILAGVVVGAFVVLLVGYKLFFGGDSESSSGGHDETEAVATDGTDGSSESEAASADAYDWNVPAYEPPDSLQLMLVARQESWATVLADGDTVLYQTLTPGRRYGVAAKYRLLVSVGVPRVVDATLNGRPAYLAHPESGRISRVEIDQTNRDQFGSPPRPATAAAPTATGTAETRTVTVDSSRADSAGTI